MSDAMPEAQWFSCPDVGDPCTEGQRRPAPYVRVWVFCEASGGPRRVRIARMDVGGRFRPMDGEASMPRVLAWMPFPDQPLPPEMP